MRIYQSVLTAPDVAAFEPPAVHSAQLALAFATPAFLADDGLGPGLAVLLDRLRAIWLPAMHAAAAIDRGGAEAPAPPLLATLETQAQRFIAMRAAWRPEPDETGRRRPGCCSDPTNGRPLLRPATGGGTLCKFAHRPCTPLPFPAR